MIKNAKLSEYYFYMNTSLLGDFQICISVPLSERKLERARMKIMLSASPSLVFLIKFTISDFNSKYEFWLN